MNTAATATTSAAATAPVTTASIAAAAISVAVAATATIDRPPSRTLQLLELRAFGEYRAALALLPLLRCAPAGDGHPVLVLPGLISNDSSTQLLRSYLADRGYAVHGWGLGRNMGLKPGLEEKMKARLCELQREHGRKVSLVGWSLGGVYAREIASALPAMVRSVVTLGAPIRGHVKSTNAWRIYELASGQRVDDPQFRRPRSTAPPVPTTSIYSRSDGIVAWQCSVEAASDRSESIEVIGSHCGLGVNAAVLYAVADRLAQPEGCWQPFDRSGPRGLVFPDPERTERSLRFGTPLAALKGAAAAPR
ncbi:MAG: esterase/lipase family protein [Caldimonas sp.]